MQSQEVKLGKIYNAFVKLFTIYHTNADQSLSGTEVRKTKYAYSVPKHLILKLIVTHLSFLLANVELITKQEKCCNEKKVGKGVRRVY